MSIRRPKHASDECLASFACFFLARRTIDYMQDIFGPIVWNLMRYLSFDNCLWQLNSLLFDVLNGTVQSDRECKLSRQIREQIEWNCSIRSRIRDGIE